MYDVCIPAEKEEVRTGEERCDNSEHVFTSVGAANATENHRYNDAVGDEQHRLDWTCVLNRAQRTPQTHYIGHVRKYDMIIIMLVYNNNNNYYLYSA